MPGECQAGAHEGGENQGDDVPRAVQTQGWVAVRSLGLVLNLQLLERV